MSPHTISNSNHIPPCHVPALSPADRQLHRPNSPSGHPRLHSPVRRDENQRRQATHLPLRGGFRARQAQKDPLATGGALRTNKSGEIERCDAAIKRFHHDGMPLHIFKSTQARDLREKVDFTDVSLQREHRGITQRHFVPNKRQLSRDTSWPRVKRRQRPSQPAQVCGCARIANVQIVCHLCVSAGKTAERPQMTTKSTPRTVRWHLNSFFKLHQERLRALRVLVPRRRCGLASVPVCSAGVTATVPPTASNRCHVPCHLDPASGAGCAYDALRAPAAPLSSRPAPP